MLPCRACLVAETGFEESFLRNEWKNVVSIRRDPRSGQRTWRCRGLGAVGVLPGRSVPRSGPYSRSIVASLPSWARSNGLRSSVRRGSLSGPAGQHPAVSGHHRRRDARLGARGIAAAAPDGPRRPQRSLSVGDAHQRIYGRPMTLGQLWDQRPGPVEQAAHQLSDDREIRNWSVGILTGQPVDDMDGGEDTQGEYISLLHGDFPIVRSFSTPGRGTGLPGRRNPVFAARSASASSVRGRAARNRQLRGGVHASLPRTARSATCC